MKISRRKTYIFISFSKKSSFISQHSCHFPHRCNKCADLPTDAGTTPEGGFLFQASDSSFQRFHVQLKLFFALVWACETTCEANDGHCATCES